MLKSKIKEIVIKSDNAVVNTTKYSFLTNIINAGLNELGIKSVSIIIKEMGETMKNNGLNDDNYTLKACIIGNETQYMLFVNKMTINEAIDILSHELIHLSQYNNKKLKQYDIKKVIWEDKEYDAINIPYMNRPWEVDAHKKDNDLAKKIRKVILS